MDKKGSRVYTSATYEFQRGILLLLSEPQGVVLPLNEEPRQAPKRGSFVVWALPRYRISTQTAIGLDMFHHRKEEQAMKPTEFFQRGKRGDKIRLNNGRDLYEVVDISKGSFARLIKLGDPETSHFVYLSGTLLRFENLNGPQHETLELVSSH